jgi:hypothetical protein
MIDEAQAWSRSQWLTLLWLSQTKPSNWANFGLGVGYIHDHDAGMEL